MSLKKGGAPEKIAHTLTISGQGVTDKLNVTYHNRKASDVQAKVEEGLTTYGIVPYLVAEWDTDFDLTEEGIKEFEDEYPGITEIVLRGYHEARAKRLEKN